MQIEPAVRQARQTDHVIRYETLRITLVESEECGHDRLLFNKEPAGLQALSAMRDRFRELKPALHPELDPALPRSQPSVANLQFHYT
jgi:hypothetical protein